MVKLLMYFQCFDHRLSSLYSTSSFHPRYPVSIAGSFCKYTAISNPENSTTTRDQG